MQRIEIKSLLLQNFKGIAKMDMRFAPDQTDVAARNGSGKTTLMYAFWWVLGLDVPDVIPTIDNKEIHNLETSVTAMIKADYEYVLKRVQTEIWKVNRATGIEEKHSNECVYYIDDVEFTLRNYKEKLSALFGFPYDKLEMLTTKDYFNTDKTPKWTWAARRKELNDITRTAELLKTLIEKNEYSLIADDIRKGFATNEIRNAKKKALKGISDDKDRNITLIEDKQNDIAKYAAIDFVTLEAQKAGYEAKITELSLSIAKADEDSEQAQTAAKLNALITERTQLAVADQNERTKLKNIADTYKLKKQAIKRYAEDVKLKIVDIDALTRRLDEKQHLQWQGETTCPTCGQALPSERIEETKHQFGIAVETDIKNLKTQIEKGKATNDSIDTELIGLRKQYAEYESEESLALAELDNFTPNPRIAVLDGEITVLKAIQSGAVDNSTGVKKAELGELQAHLGEIQSQLAYKQVLADLKVRVEELKAANLELTDKEMTLKATIQQLDAYVTESVSLITDTINELFGGGVSFALFTENYAGAESELKETCVCMYNGKLYSSMSTGEQFIANLIVTQALQRAYGVNLPIFCDKAECFTEEIIADQQIITLTAVKGKRLDNCIRIQRETV